MMQCQSDDILCSYLCGINIDGRHTGVVYPYEANNKEEKMKQEIMTWLETQAATQEWLEKHYRGRMATRLVGERYSPCLFRTMWICGA